MSERLFNFTTILDSYVDYEEIKDELKELILSDFSSRRKNCKIQIGNKIISATLGKVLLNLLIMKSFVGKKLTLSEDDLFNYESVTEDNLHEYFNKILHRGKNKTDYDELRLLIAETLNEMSDISGDLNVLAGNSLSFHDFVRLSVVEPEAKELFNYRLDEFLQFNEIEDKFTELGKRLDTFFRKHKDTEIYPFISSNTGINSKQLTQALVFVGLKPDIDGTIIPIVINDNYLNGLTSLESYFINAKGTRKALNCYRCL